MCQLIFSAIPQHLLLLLFYCCINELHNITLEKEGSKPTMSKWQVILFNGGKLVVNGGTDLRRVFRVSSLILMHPFTVLDYSRF